MVKCSVKLKITSIGNIDKSETNIFTYLLIKTLKGEGRLYGHPRQACGVWTHWDSAMLFMSLHFKKPKVIDQISKEIQSVCGSFACDSFQVFYS